MSSFSETKRTKPAKTYEEQLDILDSRGLFIANESSAIAALSSLNYYRLRGYYIHLLNGDSDNFQAGVSFDQIVSLHNFDSRLRLLLLELLFDIEIVARTRIAYEIGTAWGPLGYTDIANYSQRNHTNFNKLNERIKKDLNRSKELFIRTHNEKYGGHFPIWVTVEVMSFGDLSMLYSLLPSINKQNISNKFGNLDCKLLTNWLNAASLLRNICAHNSRLYGRGLTTHILIEKQLQLHIKNLIPDGFQIYPNTLFSYLLAIQRISRPLVWNSFFKQFNALISEYQDTVELKRIGFPYQWREILYLKA